MVYKILRINRINIKFPKCLRLNKSQYIFYNLINLIIIKFQSRPQHYNNNIIIIDRLPIMKWECRIFDLC